MTDAPDQNEILEILRQSKQLAKRYYSLTGRPLGITGEVAEYEAIRLLGLEPASVRQVGYDATRGTDRIQVKGRRLLETSKPGQRMGKIQLDKEWDAVLLVLLDGDFEAREMYEAKRKPVEEALKKPGSKARNERGALSISKFKSIGKKVWPL